MGPTTRIKLDRMVEEKSRPAQGEDPFLVAALAAALVEYRRATRQGNGQDQSENTRSNWRIISRMTQLQQRP